MSLGLLNKNSDRVGQKTDVLSAFKVEADKNNRIKESMSVKEIADVVSDHFVETVKKQFAATKKVLEAQ